MKNLFFILLLAIFGIGCGPNDSGRPAPGVDPAQTDLPRLNSISSYQQMLVNSNGPDFLTKAAVGWSRLQRIDQTDPVEIATLLDQIMNIRCSNINGLICNFSERN